ncbi:MAG: CPBP family intramembrane glutamic endopeptidase [Methanosarcinales archaeon]
MIFQNVPLVFLIYPIIIFLVLQLKKSENEKVFWGNNAIIGAVFGTLLITIIFIIEIFNNWILIKEINTDIGFILIILLFLQILVALGEEISFRGYILQNFISSIGVGKAIILSSFMFSAIHIPSMLFYNIKLYNGIIMFSTITVIGIFLSFLYLQYGLSSAVAFHFTWNFFQYNIYSLDNIRFNFGILELIYSGPELITGGQNGPEAGLLGLLMAFIFSIFIIKIFICARS